MNFLNISCKKATYLLSKKEENKLSWLERMKLRTHLAMCSLCRRFEIQTGFIGKHAAHVHAEATLSPGAKEKMQSALNNQ